MIESRLGPFQAYAAWTQILDDMDLWAEATGERLAPRLLGRAEEQALECWSWETYGRRRQDGRRKPEKSPEHDIPWPGAYNWAPRRWFPLRGVFDVPHNPLTISISHAEDAEWKRALAEFDQDFQRRLDLLHHWQVATGKRLKEFPVARTRYWREVRGRPIRHWAFWIVKQALSDADDLDRLATSAAAEAA